MHKGFTLLEMSIVLVLIAIVTSGGLVTLTAYTQKSQSDLTRDKIQAINAALLNYSIAFSRIPCPGDYTLPPSNPNYGMEAMPAGDCQSGVPAANMASNGGGVVEGAVPTRALRLPDSYMVDGWGNRFRYAVDISMTVTGNLPPSVRGALPVMGTCRHPIQINDASGAARSQAAIYALISHGANGNGAYNGNGIFNTKNGHGNANTDELTNCHCDNSGNSTGYPYGSIPFYVQKKSTTNPANPLDAFDDIVSYREAWQMQALNAPLQPKNSDYIFIPDLAGNQVVKYDINGCYITEFGSSLLHNPTGVAFDAFQNVYVVDEGGDQNMYEFTSNGVFVSQIAVTGIGQYSIFEAIASDSGGHFWLSSENSSSLYEVNPNGSLVSGIYGYSFAGVTFDATGNIWASDLAASSIREFNPTTGALLQTIGSAGTGNGQFSSPWGLAFDRNQNLWAVDTANSRIQEFNKLGAYVTQVGTYGTGNGQFGGPTGIAIDSKGNIWVADVDLLRLQKFDSSGNWLQTVSAVNGSGSLTVPYGIAILRQ